MKMAGTSKYQLTKNKQNLSIPSKCQVTRSHMIAYVTWQILLLVNKYSCYTYVFRQGKVK